MAFLTTDDYKAVSDAQTLDVIHQSDEANLERAELYAQEEISLICAAGTTCRQPMQQPD